MLCYVCYVEDMQSFGSVVQFKGQSGSTSTSDPPVPSISGDFGRFGTVLGNFAHTTRYNLGLGFLVSLGFMSGVILPIRFVHLT